jgi:hypothetical protein
MVNWERNKHWQKDNTKYTKDQSTHRLLPSADNRNNVLYRKIVLVIDTSH